MCQDVQKQTVPLCKVAVCFCTSFFRLLCSEKGDNGSVEIQWGQPYVSAIPGREERRPSETPLPVSAASATSCREGARRPAGGNKSQISFCQNVKAAPARTAQTGAGRGAGRKYANLTRPRECRMKAESRSSRHFAVRHGAPCGWSPLPASAPRGEWLAKGQTGFARGRTPFGTGKALRSPVFPFFLHPQGVPCGKKVPSLRKAVRFFAESDSVFTAKKRPPGRRNAPYRQFFHPFFNSPAPACGGLSCH